MGWRRRHEKVTIQTKTTTYNTYNEPIDSWSDFMINYWADFITKGGTEFYAAQKINAETTAVISLGYDAKSAAITTSDRVKYGSRYFEILRVNNVDEANFEVLLYVKEVV